MDKKRVLFMIGINEMAEHKDILINAVQRRLKVFSDSSDKLDADICLYPNDRNEWNKLNPELSKELFALLEKASEAENINITVIEPDAGVKRTEEYDAYYGSPSFMPLIFTGSNKPVMIADLEV